MQTLHEYSSFQAMVLASQADTTMEHYRRASRRAGDARWSGTDSFEEAVDLAQNGWTEIEEEVRERASAITARIASHLQRPEPRYGYEGLDYDIGRVLDGEPEHWLYFSPSESISRASGKVFRIALNCDFEAGVSQEVFTARGVTVCALALALDYAGMPAEIDLYGIIAAGPTSNPHTLTYQAPLKRAGDLLDIGIAIFALSHAAMFRRIVFSLMECEPPQVRDAMNVGSGYGRAGRFPRTAGDTYDVVLEGGSHEEAQWTNPDAAATWALDRIREAGIAVSESPTTGD